MKTRATVAALCSVFVFCESAIEGRGGAGYRPAGVLRVLMSPKVPMVNRCLGISAHRRSVRLGELEDGSRCWAIQARTSEMANLRCLPNLYALGPMPCTRQS
jgi:hypothetical protein